MPRRSDQGPDGARYRAALRYTIVAPRDLPRAVASRFQLLDAVPDATAVLLPRDGTAAGARALTTETASLIRSLRAPRRLEAGDGGAHRAIPQMVLDGVLEVECAGEFVSGPAAHPVWFDGAPPHAASRHAALSQDAVRHGEALGVGGLELQHRLYQFNSRPATPEWRHRLGGDPAVASYLRAATSSPRGLVHTAEPAWHYWRRRARHRARGRRSPALKLYVSPGIEGLPEALDAALTLLQSVTGMVAVKAARDVYGLMRPDSLVAYFTDRAALDEAATHLAAALAGASPQGVPFTAECGGDGLLSWATDPPADSASLDWTGDSSWRAWITGRLASSLSAAASRPARVPGWVFALDRLSLDGVDPETWTPSALPWAGQTG